MIERLRPRPALARLYLDTGRAAEVLPLARYVVAAFTEQPVPQCIFTTFRLLQEAAGR